MKGFATCLRPLLLESHLFSYDCITARGFHYRGILQAGLKVHHLLEQTFIFGESDLSIIFVAVLYLTKESISHW